MTVSTLQEKTEIGVWGLPEPELRVPSLLNNPFWTNPLPDSVPTSFGYRVHPDSSPVGYLALLSLRGHHSDVKRTYSVT